MYKKTTLQSAESNLINNTFNVNFPTNKKEKKIEIFIKV